MSDMDHQAAMEEEIARARSDLADSSADDQNSYGAGYDAGYLDGVQWALKLLRGEPE